LPCEARQRRLQLAACGAAADQDEFLILSQVPRVATVYPNAFVDRMEHKEAFHVPFGQIQNVARVDVWTCATACQRQDFVTDNLYAPHAYPRALRRPLVPLPIALDLPLPLRLVWPLPLV